MNEWLAEACRRLAAATGDDPPAYELSPADVETLLELARAAAHEGGERTNAPLLCYLVGLAHGRHPDRELAELAGEAAAES